MITALIASAAKEKVMAIEKVKEYFRKWGMENKILEFDVSSATVELAAQALNCEPGRIAKTLSFMVNGKCILIVMAGDAKIDNAKYKLHFGAKAKMLSPEEAIALTGHAIGGVCPFAVNEGVAVYLDVSLKRFSTVFPACGSSNSAIELTIPELERYSCTQGWVDICKAWQENREEAS
jgi:prolyl-tRNA editing enzyme YbaK/EbsC (Cys-tRNA(Pro) deacylase)